MKPTMSMNYPFHLTDEKDVLTVLVIIGDLLADMHP